MCYTVILFAISREIILTKAHVTYYFICPKNKNVDKILKNVKRGFVKKTREPALIFATSYSPTPHFCGAHPDGYDNQIRTNRPKFLYHAPTPKFRHPMFTRSEVILLTNKQTDADENIQRSSLRYDIG